MIDFHFIHTWPTNVGMLYADVFNPQGVVLQYKDDIEEDVTFTINVFAEHKPIVLSTGATQTRYSQGSIEIDHTIQNLNDGWPDAKQENEALSFRVKKAIEEYKEHFTKPNK